MKKVFSILLICLAAFGSSICYSQDTNDSKGNTNFTGYYNVKYPSGDYAAVNNTVFYKSNTASITSIAFGGITDDSQPGDVKVKLESGTDFSTTFFIDGFKSANNRYDFTYSLCSTSEDGQVYQKSENITSYVLNDKLILQYAFIPSLLKSSELPRVFYMNFWIKDKRSIAMIQGFYKFTVLPPR